MAISSRPQSSFSRARLDRITEVMQGFIDRGECAGMNLLAAQHGETVYEASLGMAEIETGRAMTPETIFRIYSMSKPVTVAAALILHERGCYGLDEPVSRYLPAFREPKILVSLDGDRVETAPSPREVTIRHLLTMTSGIPYPGEKTDIERVYMKLQEEIAGSGAPFTTAEIVDAVAALPLAFEPGTQWLYGLNHDVLGRLVEVWSGKRFDRFLQDEIFEPLGIADTGFHVPEEKAARFAASYGAGDDGPLTLMEIQAQSPYLQPQTFHFGGSGLVATIGDYARFARMLVQGGELDGTRILGPRTVRLMASDHLDAEQKGCFAKGHNCGYTYGLGVRVLVDPAAAGFGGSMGSFGWEGAASTWFTADPAENLIAVLMTQYIPYLSYPYDERFRTMLYAAMEG